MFNWWDSWLPQLARPTQWKDSTTACAGEPPDSHQPQPKKLNREEKTEQDSFDASRELELSINNSTIIQQYADKNMDKVLAQMPYNQTVFNKLSLVRRSSTPISHDK